MGTALIKLKIMPKSPETDLEKIKQEGKAKVEAGGAEITKFEEEPIAFGLKALIAFVRIDESKESTDFIENAFNKLQDVTSTEIIDYRRALE